MFSAGTSKVWRSRLLGTRFLVSLQCWDRAAGITHEHAPPVQAPLKAMPCIYCHSFASGQLSLGLCTASSAHNSRHHVACSYRIPGTLTDTNPKDARGACLGFAQLAEIIPSEPDHGHACVGKHPVVPVMQGRHCHRQQLQARCHRS